MHEQFERLREEGKYEGLRASILKRDVDLAGSINPMLQHFGEISEASQYSGRMVGSDWRCPLQLVDRGRPTALDCLIRNARARLIDQVKQVEELAVDGSSEAVPACNKLQFMTIVRLPMLSTLDFKRVGSHRRKTDSYRLSKDNV